MKRIYKYRYGQQYRTKPIKWWKYPLFWFGFKKAKRIK